MINLLDGPAPNAHGPSRLSFSTPRWRRSHTIAPRKKGLSSTTALRARKKSKLVPKQWAARTNPRSDTGSTGNWVILRTATCNDPANGRFRPRDPTAYCSCLGAQYQFLMTPEQVSFYEAAFEQRFRGEISHSQRDTQRIRHGPGCIRQLRDALNRRGPTDHLLTSAALRGNA